MRYRLRLCENSRRYCGRNVAAGTQREHRITVVVIIAIVIIGETASMDRQRRRRNRDATVREAGAGRDETRLEMPRCRRMVGLALACWMGGPLMYLYFEDRYITVAARFTTTEVPLVGG